MHGSRQVANRPSAAFRPFPLLPFEEMPAFFLEQSSVGPQQDVILVVRQAMGRIPGRALTSRVLVGRWDASVVVARKTLYFFFF